MGIRPIDAGMTSLRAMSLDTLNVRGIDAAAATRIRQAAAARGLTIGVYLARLVALHDAMRALADAGHTQVSAELKRLGLETVKT